MNINKKDVVIVESPTKANTIQKYLGEEFIVKASKGHIRDLPKSRLGVDIKNNFSPQYSIIRGKEKILKELREVIKDAGGVYLATDPDREGEAIAWHLSIALGLKQPRRLRLNEITRQALKEALSNASSIDMDKVNSQQARRVLDRLVGYHLSPLLWKKVKKRLSAGRVQSVALRLICEREEEIEKFIPQEYWTIDAKLCYNEKIFFAQLKQKEGKPLHISNKKETEDIIQELKQSKFIVKDILVKNQQKAPPPPFTTSTLQQESVKTLGFRVGKTMIVAQQLYEGIPIDGTPVGLITYMRTDSTRISSQALKEVRNFILQNFEKDYLPPSSRTYKLKEKIQDAHEAIRPTSVYRTPQELKPFLTKEQFLLYELIWKRFVASQMKDALIELTNAKIESGKYLLLVNGRRILFSGFWTVYPAGKIQEVILPELKSGYILDLLDLYPEQHFTQPPPHYTESSLVKMLEKKGIGRPSTYAPIIETLRKRAYVEVKQKNFIPTELGKIVNSLLVSHFSDIINVNFTSEMENELDKIEEGKKEWHKVIKDFFEPFNQKFNNVKDNIEKIKIEPEYTDEKCPLCGKPMVIRESRYGKFLGCSDYPKCKGKRKLNFTTGIPCPNPECKGEIIRRVGKNKQAFYGCTNYPECKFISWYKPLEKRCPNCNGIMVEKSKHNECIKCKYKEEN